MSCCSPPPRLVVALEARGASKSMVDIGSDSLGLDGVECICCSPKTFWLLLRKAEQGIFDGPEHFTCIFVVYLLLLLLS